MSRSNPTNDNPHPCTRWMEWSGSEGNLKYYDKALERDIIIGSTFPFLLLDTLATIKGWHDPSQSGIVSNEVRKTGSDIMTVRSFKGGPIAEGLYADIKDRVKAAGGKFTTNLYVGYKETAQSELKIGSIQLKGAALSEWMEFSKKHYKELNNHAVQIKGFREGTKGSIKYKVPNFELLTVTEDTNSQALALDGVLQEYLSGYLASTKTKRGGDETQAGYQEYQQNRQEAEDFYRSENESRPSVAPDLDDVSDEDCPF